MEEVRHFKTSKEMETTVSVHLRVSDLVPRPHASQGESWSKEKAQPRLPLRPPCQQQTGHSRRRLPLPPASSGITNFTSTSPHLKTRNLRQELLLLAFLFTCLLVSTLLMPEPHKREAAATYYAHLLLQPVRGTFEKALPLV